MVEGRTPAGIIAKHQMSKKPRAHEPHLTVKQLSIPDGGEWVPEVSGWTLAKVSCGNGYCLLSAGHTALETGTVLVLAGHGQTTLRASQLGGMTLQFFNVMPARLPGMLTLGEQDFLKTAALNPENACRLHLPESLVAARFKELSVAAARPAGLQARLQWLQLFVEAFGEELKFGLAAGAAPADARERLQEFLRTTAPSELAEMSFSELARRTHCTSRHLSRIFNELTGMSFSQKRAEIRLARARELLAGSNSKVVEVALESGYKSLSLFNLMFTRRFGTSPGRWRQKYTSVQ